MTNTLPISRELLERMLRNGLWPDAAEEVRALLANTDAGITASLAAPAVERQPDAWRCTGDIGTHHVTDNEDCANAWYSHGGTVDALYTSPPAPVAAPSDEMVQLLQRASIYARGEFLAEINACLDKVKEMNR